VQQHLPGLACALHDAAAHRPGGHEAPAHVPHHALLLCLYPCGEVCSPLWAACFFSCRDQKRARPGPPAMGWQLHLLQTSNATNGLPHSLNLGWVVRLEKATRSRIVRVRRARELGSRTSGGNRKIEGTLSPLTHSPSTASNLAPLAPIAHVCTCVGKDGIGGEGGVRGSVGLRTRAGDVTRAHPSPPPRTRSYMLSTSRHWLPLARLCTCLRKDGTGRGERGGGSAGERGLARTRG